MTGPAHQKRLLEISVGSLEHALAAQRGGADRIELCVDLDVGGLTPDDDLTRVVRAEVIIPILVMIRPRAGNFCYSDDEFTAMRASIERARRLQMEGVVLGILAADGRVDIPRTRELVNLASGMQVTFHRAFDECGDLRQSLEDVIASGAHRILTSGGAKSAMEGAAVLAELVEAAGERIVILPGAGISAENILHVAKQTGAQEFHSGLSTVLPYSSKDYHQFETEVRKLTQRLVKEMKLEN